MHMLVFEIVHGVGHVLAVIDLIEFSSSVLDLESVSLGAIFILAKISSNKWRVAS